MHAAKLGFASVQPVARRMGGGQACLPMRACRWGGYKAGCCVDMFLLPPSRSAWPANRGPPGGSHRHPGRSAALAPPPTAFRPGWHACSVKLLCMEGEGRACAAQTWWQAALGRACFEEGRWRRVEGKRKGTGGEGANSSGARGAGEVAGQGNGAVGHRGGGQGVGGLYLKRRERCAFAGGAAQPWREL